MIVLGFSSDWWAADPASRWIPPLIPYAYSQIDKENVLVSPFSTQKISSFYYHHWLGTDGLGRDVAAGLLHGLSHALWVGAATTVLALMISLLFGLCAGFYGDGRFKIKRIGILIHILLSLLGAFWGFIVVTNPDNKGFFLYIIFFCIGLWWVGKNLIKKIKIPKFEWWNKEITLPIDFLLMRLLDLGQAIPPYLFIVTLMAILNHQTTSSLILVMASVTWFQHTRLIRAAVLQIRGTDFIHAAQGLGFSDKRIILFHIFPNIVPTLMICFLFGMANTILNESSLSFLGFGMAADEVTWGSIIAGTRQTYWAWWLAIFPSVAIWLLLLLFRKFGYEINSKMKFQEPNKAI